MSIESCVIAIERDDVNSQAAAPDLKYVIKEGDTIFLQRGGQQFTFDPATQLDDILDTDLFAVTNGNSSVTYKITGKEFKALFLTQLVEVESPIASGGNMSGQTVTTTDGKVSGGTAPYLRELSWYQTNEEYDGRQSKKKLEGGGNQEFKLPEYALDYPHGDKKIWDKKFGPTGLGIWVWNPETKTISNIPILYNSESDIIEPTNGSSTPFYAVHKDVVFGDGEAVPTFDTSFNVIDQTNPWGDPSSTRTLASDDSEEFEEVMEVETKANTSSFYNPITWRAPDGCIHQGAMRGYMAVKGFGSGKQYFLRYLLKYLNKDGDYCRATIDGPLAKTDNIEWHSQNFKFHWFGHPGVFARPPESLNVAPSENKHFNPYNALVHNNSVVVDYIYPITSHSIPPTLCFGGKWRASTKSIDTEYITKGAQICKRTFDPDTWINTSAYEIVTDPFLDDYNEFWNIHDSNFNTAKVFFIATSKQSNRDNLICVEGGVWSLIYDDSKGAPPGLHLPHSLGPTRVNNLSIATLDQDRIRFLRSDSDFSAGNYNKSALEYHLFELDFNTNRVTKKSFRHNEEMHNYGYNDLMPWFGTVSGDNSSHTYGGIMSTMYTGLDYSRTIQCIGSRLEYSGFHTGNDRIWEYKIAQMPFTIFNPDLASAIQRDLLLTDDMVGKYVHSEATWDDPVANPLRLYSNSINVLSAPTNYTPMSWTTPPVLNFDWTTLEYELVDGGTVIDGLGDKKFSIVQMDYQRTHCIYVLEPPDHANMSYQEIADYQNFRVKAEGSAVTESRTIRYDNNDWGHISCKFYQNYSGSGSFQGSHFAEVYEDNYPEVLTVTCNPNSSWALTEMSQEISGLFKTRQSGTYHERPGSMPLKGDITNRSNCHDDWNYYMWTPFTYVLESFVPTSLNITVRVDDDVAHADYFLSIYAPNDNLQRRMHLLFQ